MTLKEQIMQVYQEARTREIEKYKAEELKLKQKAAKIAPKIIKKLTKRMFKRARKAYCSATFSFNFWFGIMHGCPFYVYGLAEKVSVHVLTHFDNEGFRVCYDTSSRYSDNPEIEVRWS